MKSSKIHRDIIVFYSYASADKEWRDKLANHLIQLKRDELISEWHDQQILVGSDRAQAIDQAIHSAHIILLLVSSDFLASDYCYDIEMQHALERHKLGDARVVPIILRDCDWRHSPLRDLQCLPRSGKPVTKWQDQDEIFHTITQDLRRVIEREQALARPPVPLSPINRQNRIRMLRQVQRIWISGLLMQSLHHAASIELCLQDRPDVLANPWRLLVQELDRSPRKLPDGTTIVEVYDEAEDELLILGEPGAGKTTLLLELARTLLERAEKDERLPIPIVFNLSSWAQKRQPLRTWLVEELRTKYEVARRIGNAWIHTDQVLPLLDGLDEVAKEARSACVQQINNYNYQSRQTRGRSPIVVCCRSEEYAALPTRVKLQHAISILPLTSEQVNIYLEQAGEAVKGLRQALNEDAELHELAHQPLMLTIFTLAYQGAMGAEVPTGGTHEEMRRRIFAEYTERMLNRRKQPKRWKPEQVKRCLTFLAKQMQQHDQTVFSVENLQPTWLSRRWRLLYQLCIGLLGGLVFGPILVLFCASVFGLVIEPVYGLVVGPVFGSVVGLVGWLGIGGRINPVETLTWSWKNALFGLIATLGFGLILRSSFEVVLGSFLGLPLVLLLGLGVCLLLMLSRGHHPERLSFSPNEGIRRSGKIGLVFLPVFGLLLLFLWLGHWEAVAKIGGLLWFIFGSVGLAALAAFVEHFILRFFLSRRGDLPWDLIAFLDETAERLLLRKVGGSYIFVHRQLLDYFAAIDGSILSKSTSGER